MAKKEKKKKQVRNKAKDVIADYYNTNKAYDEENRQRQKEEGVTTKGLKNLNTTEKTCVVVIVLGVIGIIIKYIIL
jgi:1,4-dihydroxy-2-naphthoate octaprenyltransferase